MKGNQQIGKVKWNLKIQREKIQFWEDNIQSKYCFNIIFLLSSTFNVIACLLNLQKARIGMVIFFLKVFLTVQYTTLFSGHCLADIALLLKSKIWMIVTFHVEETSEFIWYIQKIILLRSTVCKCYTIYIAFFKRTSILHLRLSFTLWGKSQYLCFRGTFKLIDFFHITQFITNPLLEFSLLT